MYKSLFLVLFLITFMSLHAQTGNPYFNSHRIEVEEDKPTGERGVSRYPAVPASPSHEAVRLQAKPPEK